MKGLVAIAIAIAVRKKRLAAAEPAIQFSETPHTENEPSIAVRGSRLLPPPIMHNAVISVVEPEPEP